MFRRTVLLFFAFGRANIPILGNIRSHTNACG
jgi:hypothetical protein